MWVDEERKKIESLILPLTFRTRLLTLLDMVAYAHRENKKEVVRFLESYYISLWRNYRRVYSSEGEVRVINALVENTEEMIDNEEVFLESVIKAVMGLRIKGHQDMATKISAPLRKILLEHARHLVNLSKKLKG